MIDRNDRYDGGFASAHELTSLPVMMSSISAVNRSGPS